MDIEFFDFAALFGYTLSCAASPPHLKNGGALTSRVGLSSHSAPTHAAYDVLMYGGDYLHVGPTPAVQRRL